MNQRCRALWGGLLSFVAGACAATVNPSTQDAGSPQDRPALTDLTVSPDQTTTDRPVGPFEEHIGSLDATDLDVNATDANATDLVHLDISDRPRADVGVDDVINLDAGPLPADVDPFGPEIPVPPRGRRRLLAGDRFTIVRGGGRTPRAWGAGLLQWFPDASPNAAMQVVEATSDLDRYDYQFGGTVACRVAYQSREFTSPVECWGSNQYGQLTLPSGEPSPALLDGGSAQRPISLYPRSASPGQLIVGHAFVCGTSCWGTMCYRARLLRSVCTDSPMVIASVATPCCAHDGHRVGGHPRGNSVMGIVRPASDSAPRDAHRAVEPVSRS
jgi:hypothetical protein